MTPKGGKSKKRMHRNDSEAVQEENDKRPKFDTMSEVLYS